MKIAFDMQPVLNGTKSGIGFHTDGLIKNLIKNHPKDSFIFNFYSRGYVNAVSTIKTYQQEGREISLQECRIISGKLYRLLWNIFRIPYRYFFKENADVTHFFNFCIPPGVKGKKIVTIHDMAIKRCPKTVRLRTKIMLNLNLKHSIKRADAIIAVSEFTKREILKFFDVPEKKIIVVPNGVDTNRFFPDHALDEVEKVKETYGIKGEYLLYLGTIEPRKNLVSLVKAYARINKMMPEKAPKLVIAGGKGWLCKDIYEEIERSDVKNNIILTGYVADEAVPLLMSGALCFCFPSFYEGFGMPVLEAMACGTPVLVSENTVLDEIVGNAGVKVNPFSIESIESALFAICQKEDLRQTLIERGYKRIKQYTWDLAEKRLYQVYMEVLENKMAE